MIEEKAKWLMKKRSCANNPSLTAPIKERWQNISYLEITADLLK